MDCGSMNTLRTIAGLDENRSKPQILCEAITGQRDRFSVCIAVSAGLSLSTVRHAPAVAMISDPYERKVAIPVRIRDGKVIPFNGVALPALKDETVGDLVVPSHCFRSGEELQDFLAERPVPVLQAGTKLLVPLPPGTPLRTGILQEPPRGAAPNTAGPFAEIFLDEELMLTLRTAKRAALRPCQCKIPSLKRTARSLNHACTLISEEFEPDRLSHTGNAFSKVLYERVDRAGLILWVKLELLRVAHELTADQILEALTPGDAKPASGAGGSQVPR